MVTTSHGTAVLIRQAGPDDLGFLWEMLYEAVHWMKGLKPSREELLSDPELRRYVEGWGRPGDAAVVAVDREDGRRIGAAWCRLMPPEAPGYGFVDAATPEAALAVLPGERGRGVGTMLLRDLMDAAGLAGFGALSLSVRRGNPAVRLYERHGFRKLSEAGDSWTMRGSVPREDAAPDVSLRLCVLGERLAVCRLSPGSEVPAWATAGGFFSATRTEDELSVVCPEERVPAGVRCERGWRALKVEGPLDFSLVGVLSSLAAPLAEAGVSIFAVSTYETDYVLVKEEQLSLAAGALCERGHEVS